MLTERRSSWQMTRLLKLDSFPVNRRSTRTEVRYLLAFCHRALAALAAISRRFLVLRFFALAAPPFRPSATAAAFLPSSVTASSISLVAILMTWTAFETTPVGACGPSGTWHTPLSIASDRCQPSTATTSAPIQQKGTQCQANDCGSFSSQRLVCWRAEWRSPISDFSTNGACCGTSEVYRLNSLGRFLL